jgi:magnesium chelatase accessory protein
MFSLSVKPDWSREGRDWPHRDASRFVFAAGLRWHVQVMGSGPAVLLVHGTGAASHSWRDVAPRLAGRFTVIAPDLPGHGFTETPPGDGLSLRGMARGLAGLLAKLDVEPPFVVGHSAGAAIALRMALDGRFGGGVVSFNGALKPFPGAAGRLYPTMAKAMFLNPVAQQLFQWRATRPGAVAGLLRSTGSTIDPSGVRSYEALMGTTGHIAGALGMMARWNLQGLQAELPSFSGPLTLVTGGNDLAVPPSVSEQVHRMIPASRLIQLPGLGHLAHEEAPERAAEIIAEACGGAPPQP